MSDSLFASLPIYAKPRAPVVPLPVIACVLCGSLDWTRCSPGTASTAELYPKQSNIVALRSDDGVPLVAYCNHCDPLLIRS